MNVAYYLSCSDDDSYMLPKKSDGLVCSKCGAVTAKDYLNPRFKPKKRKLDLVNTYDGYYIASERFRLFCEESDYSGLEFVQLPASPSYFWFKVQNIVRFNLTTRTSSTEFCELCQRHRSVGGFPYGKKFLADTKEPLADGFYRTDIEMGYRDLSPLLIVGPETKNKIVARKLHGLCFDEILA